MTSIDSRRGAPRQVEISAPTTRLVWCRYVAGQPDFGVLIQTEMFEHIRRICRATSLPVFADADTGGVHDAQRTIRLWEEAGASVLHVDDQANTGSMGVTVIY